MKGINKDSNANVIRLLYLVPRAKPHITPEYNKYFNLKPLSDHFNINNSDANEKKITPRSTYTFIDNFTITGIERKKSAPDKPYITPALFFKYLKINHAVKSANVKWINLGMISLLK